MSLANSQIVQRDGYQLTAEGQGIAEMTLRTARKAHRCHTRTEDGVTKSRWAGRPVPTDHTPEIRRGDVYVEYLGEAAPYGSGSRYCIACMIEQGIATRRVEG